MAALIDTYAQFPLDVVSGHGSRLRDRGGREYWDFYGGHAVALLGHSHPAVVEAIAKQAAELTFYSNAFALDVRTQAAERLAAFAPPGLSRVFFCNSGAEANENAIKLAIRHTGALALPRWSAAGTAARCCVLPRRTIRKLRRRSPACCATRSACGPTRSATSRESTRRSRRSFWSRFRASRASWNSAATSSALRQRCDQTGTLLIYDEIQTGMGRLGRPLAAGDFGVTPDLATLAKGIANGIPMGAVLMSDPVAAKIKTGDLASTFGGGPVACAAHLAVLDTIQRENLVAGARELGEAMRGQLCVGPVEAVLGRGCLIGLRVRGDAKLLQGRLMNSGFVTGTSANPQVLRLMPPINMPLGAVLELSAALKDM